MHKTTTRCCSPSSNDSFSIESFLHSISLISVPFSFLYSISFSSVSLRSLLQEQAPARGRSFDSSPAMPRNSGAAGTLSSHHTNYGLIFCASHPFLTNLQRFFISAGSGPRVVKRPGGGTAASASRSAAAAAAPPPPQQQQQQRGDAPAPRTPPPALALADRGPPPPAQPLRRSCRSPSCPGTRGGDWDEATALDNAQAVSDDVCRDPARRRRRRRRHSDTNAMAVAAPAAAAAASGQRQLDRAGSAASARPSK